ncbi:putative glycine cleavage system H protein, mitochondrial precursor [Meira miltonrushii]|uniref:Glycine cleavage system H protein n=1 Tax=Meira miltonrushii TaxID=1280837 RepID=A0A316VM69_9BASI|nr:putative glycine cleavage system H protein, mitochondrial precursor [Meira miltonrushii]PWN38410.1 putative glycine cleavage system H protein, mitochondrial precursor [Meira miltonrushii]
MLAPLRSAQPIITRSICRGVQAPRIAAIPLQRSFASSSIVQKTSIRYTAEHEWVKFDDENSTGLIGITDYAQKSLGDVVYVELPKEGSEVQQGEQIGAVESVKAASDIYSPVTGQVESVNSQLGEEPGLLNKSPEEKGWLCRIKLNNPAEFEELLDEEAYTKLTEDA